MTFKLAGTVIIANDDSINVSGIVTAANYTGKGMIPAASVCYFFQANAPTGFTKLVANNDYTLRVVNGTASSGGSANFSAVFPSSSTTPLTVTATIGGATLTTPQLASHTHPSGAAAGPPNVMSFNPFGVYRTAVNTGNTPASAANSHSHPSGTASGTLDMRVQYIDVIAASRDA